MATRYSLHVDRWNDCTACALHRDRKSVVLCRGVLPADVLFVGEAPGKAEDSIGEPFVGPAGQLLDEIVSRACTNGERIAFTNLIACIPWDEEEDGKLAEPPDFAIEACSLRLAEFIEIANPSLIVCVGRHAADWLTPGYRWSIPLHRRIPLCKIQHPAYLLRLNTIQRNLGVQRAVVQVRTALAEMRKM